MSLNILQLYRFTIYADKLNTAYLTGDESKYGINILECHITSMRDIGPPTEEIRQRLIRLLWFRKKKGWFNPKTGHRLVAMMQPLDLLRKKCKIRIENLRMKQILKLCLPQLASAAKSRGLSPDNPLCLSSTVSKLIEDSDATNNDFMAMDRALKLTRKLLKEFSNRRAARLDGRLKKIGY